MPGLRALERYSQYRLFVMSTWLFMLAKFAFVFLGGFLAVLFGFFWPAGYKWLPKWWAAGFSCVFATFLLFGWMGVLMAAFLKCDVCGRRPTLVWDLRYKQPHPSSRRGHAIRDFLIPQELRQRKFQCVHCKREFSLYGNGAPNHGIQPTR